MKKELGVHPYLFPMPVLMIATYGDDNVVDVMNMAWGGICAENMVSLNIDEDHKTAENIKKRGAFTLSIADIPRRFLRHRQRQQDAGQVRAQRLECCKKRKGRLSYCAGVPADVGVQGH